jgi:tetratricopeptide (TPR) repeat protein
MRKSKVIFCLIFMFFVLGGLTANLRASENFLEKGIAEYKAENYEEALELLIKAREQQPQSSEGAYYLGLNYRQVGNHKEAAKQLRDAIHLTPSIKDAYSELIEVLYTMNEFKEAMGWVRKAEKEGVKPAQVAFLKGLILLKQGKTKDAIEAFKKAKEMDPTLAQPSDFQIAMAYTKEKRFAEAKESLKAVISIDPASEVASFAREYEKAFVKTLETYRTWRFTAGVAYQYDDNVVLNPSTAIPGVLITGQRDSSVITTFRADYNPLLSGPWFFNGQFNFYANTYFSTKSYNLISPTITLMPGYNFQNGAVTLPLSYNYTWLHEREYQSVATVKPTLNIAIFPDHIGQLSMGYARRDLLKRPLTEDENRDGNIYLLTTGYVHPFLEGRGVFSVRYEFSRDVTQGKNWDNIGHRFIPSLLVPVIDKVNFTISGDILLQDYAHVHSAFHVKRRDRTYSGSTGVIWEILKGLNLNLFYSHTTTDSNINIYAYKRNVYTAGIEYTF